MSILDDFQPVTKARPCPICGRLKYCLLSRDDPDNPSKVLCTKIESGVRWREAGWLHRLRDDGWRSPSRRVSVAITLPDPHLDVTNLALESFHVIDPARLRGLADELCLSEKNLRRLRVGWAPRCKLRELGTQCRGAGCFTFPMRDSNGKVIGIRLRAPDGYKFAVSGSRNGLFVPDDLDGKERLLITEGPTDCAALLDLDFQAIGRPSCNTGTRLITNLVQRHHPSEVVIVADGDPVGLRGAESLSSVLVVYTPRVRLLVPPTGIKDARAWKRTGADHDELLAEIEAAPIRRLTVGRSRGKT